jgi:hypothetical protein
VIRSIDANDVSDGVRLEGAPSSSEKYWTPSIAPEVIEMVQPMSPGMKGAQGALLVAINTVIKELKR